MRKPNYVNRLMDSCTRKCIPPNFNEGELNKGESVCIDRCVNKFMLVAKLIQEKIQEQQGGAGL
jgi:mitochondrial import inner membrane translocase subunit TIM10